MDPMGPSYIYIYQVPSDWPVRQPFGSPEKSHRIIDFRTSQEEAERAHRAEMRLDQTLHELRKVTVNCEARGEKEKRNEPPQNPMNQLILGIKKKKGSAGWYYLGNLKGDLFPPVGHTKRLVKVRESYPKWPYFHVRDLW